MSIAFKFKSDHQFESVDIADGRGSLTVAELRQVVTDRRLAGSATAFGLRISNADTGQGAPLAPRAASTVHRVSSAIPTRSAHDTHASVRTEFLDDNAAVAAGTSVLIRRVPLSLATGGCTCSDNLCARPIRSPFRVVPSQRLVLGGRSAPNKARSGPLTALGTQPPVSSCRASCHRRWLSTLPPAHCAVCTQPWP